MPLFSQSGTRVASVLSELRLRLLANRRLHRASYYREQR